MKITSVHLIVLFVIGVIGYIIPVYLGDIWLAIGISLLVGTVFIALLLGSSKQYFQSLTTYRIVTAVTLLFILTHAIRFAFDYDRRDWQTNHLLEIRETIEVAAATSEVKLSMFEVLRDYHLNEKDSIIETAEEVLADHLIEGNTYLTNVDLNGQEGDSLTEYYYEKDFDNDLFRVIVVAMVPDGEDSDFKNYNGSVGRLEMEFELTKEGVEYEVRN